ncbi:MAG: hypothetical protein U1A78_37825 [Polyangia bacterium]
MSQGKLAFNIIMLQFIFTSNLSGHARGQLIGSTEPQTQTKPSGRKFVVVPSKPVEPKTVAASPKPAEPKTVAAPPKPAEPKTVAASPKPAEPKTVAASPKPAEPKTSTAEESEQPLSPDEYLNTVWNAFDPASRAKYNLYLNQCKRIGTSCKMLSEDQKRILIRRIGGKINRSYTAFHSACESKKIQLKELLAQEKEDAKFMINLFMGMSLPILGNLADKIVRAGTLAQLIRKLPADELQDGVYYLATGYMYLRNSKAFEKTFEKTQEKIVDHYSEKLNKSAADKDQDIIEGIEVEMQNIVDGIDGSLEEKSEIDLLSLWAAFGPHRTNVREYRRLIDFLFRLNKLGIISEASNDTDSPSGPGGHYESRSENRIFWIGSGSSRYLALIETAFSSATDALGSECTLHVTLHGAVPLHMERQSIELSQRKKLPVDNLSDVLRIKLCTDYNIYLHYFPTSTSDRLKLENNVKGVKLTPVEPG